MTKRRLERLRIYAPPWMIIGISTLFMAVVVIVGLMNYNREKNTMAEILREKGAALIRSFEAGARTGMMGLFGSEGRLQVLMDETASQKDIAYIVIADKDGTVLAGTEKDKIGEPISAYVFNVSFSPGNDPGWRIVKNTNGKHIFEVFKRFLPLESFSTGPAGSQTDRIDSSGMMSCIPGWMGHMPADRILDPKNRPVIIIGMDVTPFEQATAEDQRNNAVTLGLIFLLSVTGVITLFWAQNIIQSRELLQDTRAYASEIVANLPVGIVVAGENGQIHYINAVAGTLLDVPADRQEDGHAETIFPESILGLLDRISPDTPVAEGEFTLGKPGERATPVSVSVTNVMNSDGRRLGYMVILKDLSELRKLEAEIQQGEKMAAVGNLAAGIAHEVRNPLSSIKGYASFLGSLFESGSENRKAADIMVEEVDRVNRVISELLEFARPSDLERRETDMNDLITHSLDIVAHEASFAGISTATDIDSNLPMMNVDPDRMTQVLLNLMINAIQAMDRGGRLTVSAHPSDGRLVIGIGDTGRGIPACDIPHVFNPYFTHRKNGTGLGLAIVHKIVESHNGTVHITSRENEGTTVSVSLPIQNERILK